MPPVRPAKGKKARNGGAGPTHKPSGAKAKTQQGKPITLKDLKWKAVSVPAMSLSAGPEQAKGLRDIEDETQDLEWDPFADLDEGADDFMGLQEVSGVGVKFEGTDKTGKRIGFYQSNMGSGEEGDAEAGPSSLTKKEKMNKIKGKAAAVPVARADKAAKKSSPEQDIAESDEDAEGIATTSDVDEADEEEEFKGFGDDDDEDDDDDVSEASMSEANASTDQNDIPEGIFSSMQTDLDLLDAEGITGAASFDGISFDDADLRSWPNKILKGLHPALKHALVNLKFTKPTPIQTSSLPKILPPSSVGTSTAESPQRSRDVVALAQTGSGKTLAYALPILQKILASRSSIYGGATRPLQALIVLPTRELAMQVHSVFQSIMKAASEAAGTNGKPWVRIAPVLGGMSEERQWRLLRGRSSGQKGADGSNGKDAEIIIATVGRLWELCKSDDYLPTRLADAETLVLDEADRLLETGKFQELASVLDLLQNPDRQTLMFSATLDPTLQVNLSKSRAKVARAMKRSKDQDKMASLMDKVGFKDARGAELVDLTAKAMLSDSLTEGKIECLDKEKDLYLYYMLLRYPGSTLVFFNSIDSVRRVQPLLTNLQINVFPLHGEMDQKARLKALDNFKKAISGKIPAKQSNGAKANVLLATDVAARGLDIPAVEHVVHFHLPRSTDTYIHRSGRTARAGRSGLSLILLSPTEKNLWASLQRNLSRGDSKDVSDLEVVYSIMGRLKKRLSLSKEIDEKRHRERKEVVEDNWMKKLADEAEIALDDEDVDLDADHAVGRAGSSSKGKKAASSNAAVRALEEELKQELQRSLLVRGVKRKFITQGIGLDLNGNHDAAGGLGGGKEGLQGLIDGTGHDVFLGLHRSKAQDDLGRARGAGGSGSAAKKQKQKQRKST